MTITRTLIAVGFSVAVATHALAETRHGLSLSYAPNSAATLSGKHLNLYDPARPESYRVEETHAEGGELSDIFSLGYRLRKPLAGNLGLDLGLAFTQAIMAAQQVDLVSQEGPFRVSSNQPNAHARYIELYLGANYSLSAQGSWQPYLGAGVSLLYGKAFKTYYNLEELLAGADTYGRTGSSNMDGVGIHLKAGVQFDRWALELSHGQYDTHIDQFRSFEIDGADLEFNQTMLSVVFDL